jgi:hypothetical protein
VTHDLVTSFLSLSEDIAKALAYGLVVSGVLIVYIHLSLTRLLARMANDQERLRIAAERLQQFLQESSASAPEAPAPGAPKPQAAEAEVPAAPVANGLPDGMDPAAARKELMAELKGLSVDDLRRKIRLLPTAEREAIREWVPRLEKARKDDMITGLCRIVGL